MSQYSTNLTDRDGHQPEPVEDSMYCYVDIDAVNERIPLKDVTSSRVRS